MTEVELRSLCTRYAWTFLGRFYKWGGDDPSGFDCSGLVCELLQAVGKIGRKEDLTAAALWQRFMTSEVKQPYEGCLVFYAAKQGGPIIHIEYCIDEFHAIGASGGGSATITEQDAINQNAYIKIRTIRSRPFIVGFVDPFK